MKGNQEIGGPVINCNANMKFEIAVKKEREEENRKERRKKEEKTIANNGKKDFKISSSLRTLSIILRRNI